MAIKTVSIGTAYDIYRFDDGDTEYGIETSGKIKVDTAPTVNNEVVRLQDIVTPGNGVSAAANIADNAVVRGDGGAKGVQDSGVIIDDADNVTIPGYVKIQTMKSGATQVAAGAAAGELWETSGHASLPDHVVMLGV